MNGNSVNNIKDFLKGAIDDARVRRVQDTWISVVEKHYAELHYSIVLNIIEEQEKAE